MRIADVLRNKGAGVLTVAPDATVGTLLAGLVTRNVGAMVVVDDGEIREHQWIRPADALTRRELGEIELIPPTWVTLHKLADAASTRRNMATASGPPRQAISPMSQKAGC